MRNFMLIDKTVHFDWPNYQYAYPWRLWFDAAELADVTVNPPVVNSGGVVIPNSAIFWGDPNYPEPPFTYLELDRSKNYSFGNGPTPQREVAITGSFGYWRVTEQAGTLAAAITDTVSQSVTVSDGHTPGVGDMMFVDNERMLVTNSSFASLSLGFTAGITSAFASDNSGTTAATLVPDEVISVDQEFMLVQQVSPFLVIKRAWGGSTLASHAANTPIYARRQLTVNRGVNGSTAATHSNSAAVSILSIPAPVKQLAIAESIVFLTQEASSYSAIQTRVSEDSALGGTGRSAIREPQPGAGLDTLRFEVVQGYGRQARSRVI